MARLRTSTQSLTLALLCLAPVSGEAAIVEEIVWLPVFVTASDGARSRYEITVTVFRDDERAKAPFLVLNHGRSGSAGERARFGRSRYSEASRWFVEQGFAVFLPTRLGYGVTGGPDLDRTGPCELRDFAPGFAAAAQQSEAVVAYAKSQRYVRADRGLLVGQSYGGATTLALLAKNIDGVLGGVNFAGGSGGNPGRRPEAPCSPAELARVIASYGATSRRPSLWLYAENDRYWGTVHPRQWFDGFRASGGVGDFVTLPAHGDDGHSSFSRNPDAWRPHVLRFLKSLGLTGRDDPR
jgi:dienelactone hydrolase